MAGNSSLIYINNQLTLSQISKQGKYDLSLQKQLAPVANKTPEETKAIVWVASEKIHFSQVQLATRKASVLYKTLPFALEEKIANEPQENHYAFYKTPIDTPLPVAIVEHSLIKDWQTALHLHGIYAEALLPDIFAVPNRSDTTQHTKDLPPTSSSGITEKNHSTKITTQADITPALETSSLQPSTITTQHVTAEHLTTEHLITEHLTTEYWSLWYEMDRCVVRTGHYEGFACNLAWFKDLLRMYRQKVRIDLLIWTPDLHKMKEDWPEIQSDAQTQIIPTHCLFYQHLANQSADHSITRSAINLLQNTYTQQSRWLKHLSDWKQEITLMVALVGCLLLLGITNLYQTYQATQHLEQAIEKLYFELFPESKKIRNLKAQTQANINELSQKFGRNSQSMWPTFEQISEIFQTCHDCVITSMKMTMNQLNLSIQQTEAQNNLISQLEKIKGIKLQWEIKPIESDQKQHQFSTEKPVGAAEEPIQKPNYLLTLDIRKP